MVWDLSEAGWQPHSPEKNEEHHVLLMVSAGILKSNICLADRSYCHCRLFEGKVQ